jgi:hypothetical protein
MNTNNKLNELEFLLGRWSTAGTVNATIDAAEIKFQGTDTYDLILDGKFILHKVDVMMGGEHIEVVEIIGESASTNKGYALRSFDNRGVYTEMSADLDAQDQLVINGDKMRAFLKASGPGKLSARWERLAENANWIPWMDLTLTKG